MADDSMVTVQLRQLTLRERLELEEASQSSTGELKQLQDAADELVASLGGDIQQPHDTTITEIPRPPKIKSDSLGHSVWVDPIDTAELKITSAREMKQLLHPDKRGKDRDGYDPYNQLRAAMSNRMTDDTAVTDRLRQLAEEVADECGGHTIVIDDLEPETHPDDDLEENKQE